jgi:sugar phosphate isomerase/epimerase
MRLGFYADYSESVAKFAHEVGFDSMELSAWPKSALDANVATPKAIDAILKDLNSKDIERWDSIADNLPIFEEEFSRLVDEAEKRGVRLAIENCLMMNNKEMKGTLHSQGSPKNGDRADNRVSKLFLSHKRVSFACFAMSADAPRKTSR